MTHICVSRLSITGSNAEIGPLGTNFNEILIGNQTFSFKKIHLKMSSAKWRPFCLGLNVLSPRALTTIFTTGFWMSGGWAVSRFENRSHELKDHGSRWWSRTASFSHSASLYYFLFYLKNSIIIPFFSNAAIMQIPRNKMRKIAEHDFEPRHSPSVQLFLK